jgi:UDP-N-acetylglucosamine 2-epimerase (non-hydrolysing)
MLDQVLKLFHIKPHYDLNLMTRRQNLFHVTSRGLKHLEKVLRSEGPDLIIVQGDTTSTLAGGLAAYYAKIPLAHVEAGLRSGDKYRPYPEEINRKIIGVIADLHFAPTALARDNLLREGIADECIRVTGNTGVDALRYIVGCIERSKGMKYKSIATLVGSGQRLILVTAHRRESFGKGLINICQAIRDIATRFKDVTVLFPVHLNPNVTKPVREILSGLENVKRVKPLKYDHFVWALNKATLILTDSGGIQEEAASLGKPVLVMRQITERPEGVEAGIAVLAGLDRASIVNMASRFLSDPVTCKKIARRKNLYGDGKASMRILEAIYAYKRNR